MKRVPLLAANVSMTRSGEVLIRALSRYKYIDFLSHEPQSLASASVRLTLPSLSEAAMIPHAASERQEVARFRKAALFGCFQQGYQESARSTAWEA